MLFFFLVLLVFYLLLIMVCCSFICVLLVFYLILLMMCCSFICVLILCTLCYMMCLTSLNSAKILYIPACFSLLFARYYYPFPPPISLIPAHRATVISASWYFHSSNFLPHPVTFIFYTVCSYMEFFSSFRLTSPGFTNPAGKFSAF